MHRKSYIALICISLLLLASFMLIAIILSTNGYIALPLDNAIAQFFYSIRGEYGGFTYWFFRIFTELGYTYCIVAVLLIFAIVNRFRLHTWLFAGSTIALYGLQTMLKHLFIRPRPDPNMWWMIEHSSSFPSGHSMMVVFIFVLLSYFILSSPRTRVWLRRLVCILSAFAIIIVSISRLVLGVHYFTDVLAGMCLGGAFALIFIILHQHFSRRSTNTTTQSGSQ